MISNDDDKFSDAVMALADDVPAFKPIARYDADGDCIEFFAKPDGFYAERVDDLVTVYYSQETGEIVGSLIKGVSNFRKQLHEKLPGLVIEIHDEKILLQHLFRARLWSEKRQPQDVKVIQYRKLIDLAEASGVEADMSVSAS